MSNLRVLPNTEINPNDVMEGAKERGLSEVLIIGWTDDDELYIAASKESEANAIMLMEIAKHWLINQVLEFED